MASRTMMLNQRAAGEAVESRLLVAALFAGCLPSATARWIRRDARDRHSPLARSLQAARDAVAQIYSLPG